MKRNKRAGGSAMQVGRTIAQEREKLESESVRIAAREKAKNRQTITILIFVLGVTVIGILVMIGLRSFAEQPNILEPEANTVEVFESTVEVVDESGVGVTKRTSEYIGMLEKDFEDLGYKVTRVAVPAGKRREVDIYLDGIPYYIKVNIDRGTAVSAEDADRMIRYLASAGLTPGYVDVRVEGKAFYQ